MRRLLPPLIAFAVLVSACGEDDPPDVQVSDDSATTTTPAPTSAPDEDLPVTGMCGDLIPVVTDQGTNCVDPDAPVSTTVRPSELEWPGETFPDGPLPPLLVADGTELMILGLDDDGTLAFARVGETLSPVTDIRQAADGTIFTREWDAVSEDETVIEFARYAPDGTRTVLDELVALYDVAMFDGVEVVVGAVASSDGYGFGGVKAFAVDDLREIADFGLAAEAEFGVISFDWSDVAVLGVASAWSDLTEWIGFVDARGGTVELPSPTDDLAYNAPPLVTGATLSLDGRTLYWVEGPDWGFDPGTGESGPVAAPWVLRGADLQTGDETLHWELSELVLDSTVLDVHSVEDLGDHILVNRSRLNGTEPVFLAPLVLDFTVEEPELFEFPAFGVATRAADGVVG